MTPGWQVTVCITKIIISDKLGVVDSEKVDLHFSLSELEGGFMDISKSKTHKNFRF